MAIQTAEHSDAMVSHLKKPAGMLTERWELVKKAQEMARHDLVRLGELGQDLELLLGSLFEVETTAQRCASVVHEVSKPFDLRLALTFESR